MHRKSIALVCLVSGLLTACKWGGDSTPAPGVAIAPARTAWATSFGWMDADKSGALESTEYYAAVNSAVTAWEASEQPLTRQGLVTLRAGGRPQPSASAPQLATQVVVPAVRDIEPPSASASAPVLRSAAPITPELAEARRNLARSVVAAQFPGKPEVSRAQQHLLRTLLDSRNQEVDGKLSRQGFMEAAIRRFAILDRNKDGKLTADDMVEAARL